MASYTSGLVRRAFMVRWYASPAAEDPGAILHAVTRARTLAGELLAYFSVLFTGAGAMAGSNADPLLQLAKELPRHCSRLHYVIDDAGEKNGVVRGSIVALMHSLGHASMLSVHSNVDAGLLALAADLHVEAAVLRREVGARGLI